MARWTHPSPCSRNRITPWYSDSTSEPCETIAPFGRPVVPLVYICTTGSSGRIVAKERGRAGAAATHSSHARHPSCDAPSATNVSTDDRSSRTASSSATR